MVKEHYLGIKSSTPKTAPRIRDVFARQFPTGQSFYQGLVTQTSLNAAYHASIILGLREYYTDEVIDSALQKAGQYHAYSQQAIKGILKSAPLKEVKEASAGMRTSFVPNPLVEVRPLSYYANLLREEG